MLTAKAYAVVKTYIPLEIDAADKAAVEAARKDLIDVFAPVAEKMDCIHRIEFSRTTRRPIMRNAAGNASAVLLSLPMLALFPMIAWAYPWLVLRKTAAKVKA